MKSTLRKRYCIIIWSGGCGKSFQVPLTRRESMGVKRFIDIVNIQSYRKTDLRIEVNPEFEIE